MSVLFLPPSAGAASVPDASETVSGKIRIATSAEATAGTNDLTAMTPAKTKSVVDAAVVGGVTYQGTFDASSPADLSNASKGDLYIISVAGTYQGQTWAVGDHLLINADMGGTLDPAKIDKVDNTDSVTSVAGRTGAVTLSTADISGLATVASTGAYSDLTGVPTLGTAAAEDVGTSAGNVVQLDGTAKLPAVDGSQLTNLPSAPVTSVAGKTGAVTLVAGDISGLATVATTGAYSDLTGTPTLGTAAAEDVGTLAGNVVQLDGSARLPAVDGSQLTNLPSGASTLGALTDVDTAGVVDTNVLKYDSGTSTWVDGAVAYSEVTGTPTLGTASAEDVGTSAGNVVQLDGSARLPAVDGSQLTNLPSGASTLGALTDVTLTSVADGQFLKYDSTSGDWVNGDSGLYDSVTYNTSATMTAPSEPKTLSVALNGTLSTRTLTLYTAATDTVGTVLNISNYGSVDFNVSTQGGQSIRGVLGSVTSFTLAPNQTAVLTQAQSGAFFLVAYEEQGLGSLADVDVTGAVATNVLKYDGADWVDGAVAYSEVTGTPTLGTAAALDVGTSANNVVQLNGSAQLPAVDGSLLTGITASVAALNDVGDVNITSVQDYAVLKYDSGTSEWIDVPQLNYVLTSTTQSLDLKPGVNRVVMAGSSSITLTLGIPTLVAGQGAVFSVLSTGSATNTLTIGSTSWSFDQNQGGVFQAVGLNTAYMVSTIDYNQLENLPTLGTAAALDVGTSAGNVVQLDGSARLPAVDGSQLLNLPSAPVTSVAGKTGAVTLDLNDNTDVSYTPGAAIDNYVLTYDHATASWGAEPSAGGGGGSLPTVTTTTTSYTVPARTTELARTVIVNNGASAVTITLPSIASGDVGFTVDVKVLGTGSVTIDAGSNFIDDGTTTSISVNAQYDSRTLQAGSTTDWYII